MKLSVNIKEIDLKSLKEKTNGPSWYDVCYGKRF